MTVPHAFTLASHLRVAATLLALAVACASASAQVPSVDFGGEHFVRKFESDKVPTHPFAEFVRDSETMEGWTKLVTFHSYPKGGNDPMLGAATLVQALKQHYKEAKFSLIKNPQTGEVIVDFLVSPPNSEVVEFDVFRYARGPGDQGLIAAQYAFRFKLGTLDAEDVGKLRQKALDEMANLDMATVRDYFGKAK